MSKITGELRQPESRGTKPHTYRNRKNRRRPRIEIMKPTRFFIDGQHDCGGGGARKHGDHKTRRPSKHKGSHQFNEFIMTFCILSVFIF